MKREEKKVLPEEKRKYTKRYFCENCGWWFTQLFDFGEIASQGSCPNCGVNPYHYRYEKRFK
jgi:predicted RNA-binding Zn-ribbon protein involved in translation (DUF1610 family)